MSSRRSTPGLLVALSSAALVLASSAFAVSACSSSTDDTAKTDGGVDATADGRRVVEGGEDPDSSKLTPAQCEAKCKVDHPNAAPKEDAIDKCWTDNCSAPCIDQSGGFDGGTDAGTDADAGEMLCGTPVTSGVDETCDQCTEAFCCTSWKGCFNDPDCTAYDTCIGDCNP